MKALLDRILVFEGKEYRLDIGKELPDMPKELLKFVALSGFVDAKQLVQPQEQPKPKRKAEKLKKQDKVKEDKE